MNAQGVTLEEYVKDLFCGTTGALPALRTSRWDESFSYQGTQNNPPDFMIRGGDAVEVKKREAKNARIHLNSSPPKHKLLIDDSRLNEDCRNCEEWKQKDILYVFGQLEKRSPAITSLWFVYGDCYAAPHGTYDRFVSEIRNVLERQLAYGEAQRTETNELGGVKGLDPKQRTNLRIRAMWDILGPEKTFGAWVDKKDCSFSAHAVLKSEKYYSFPDEDRSIFERSLGAKTALKNAKISDPSGSSIQLDAKIFSFWE
jgi:hypothetical protein